MELTGKRVLVTGGNGYLGRHLVRYLKGLGAVVFATDIAALLEDRYFKTDITDEKQVAVLLDAIQPQVVFHLAALIDRTRSFDAFASMERVNVGGTANVLKGLAEQRCEKFVYVSSSEVYGDLQAPFREDMLPRPVSPYSLTKLNAEHTVAMFSDLSGLNSTIVRLFNFYGRDMPQQFFIPQMLQAFRNNESFDMTEGEQLRDFLYLDDVLNGLVKIASSDLLNGKTVNLCSGRATSLKELALSFRDAMGSHSVINFGAVPYRKNEVWNMQGDNSLLRNTTGFIPLPSTSAGVNWFNTADVNSSV